MKKRQRIKNHEIVEWNMRKIICISVIILLVLALAGTAGLAYWLYTDYVSPEEIAAQNKA